MWAFNTMYIQMKELPADGACARLLLRNSSRLQHIEYLAVSHWNDGATEHKVCFTLSCSSVQVSALRDGGLQHQQWCGHVLVQSKRAPDQARVCRHGPVTSQPQLPKASSRGPHHWTQLDNTTRTRQKVTYAYYTTLLNTPSQMQNNRLKFVCCIYVAVG